TLDRDRIRRAGAPAAQIETNGACRLDAAMVARALPEIDLAALDLLVIENVGNLICPCGPKLGEHLKIAVLSLPEGDDKPAKYPAVFALADAAVFTKIDLLPHLNYDLDRAVGDCRKINSRLRVFPLSPLTGEGMDEWTEYLRSAQAGLALKGDEPPAG
ncbi:MAG: hydrogenase nickel incorporation protein HypB, partial [bacterium]